MLEGCQALGVDRLLFFRLLFFGGGLGREGCAGQDHRQRFLPGGGRFKEPFSEQAADLDRAGAEFDTIEPALALDLDPVHAVGDRLLDQRLDRLGEVAGPVRVAADLHGVFFAVQRVLDALEHQRKVVQCRRQRVVDFKGRADAAVVGPVLLVVLGDLIKELLGDGSRGLRQMQAAVEQLLVGFTLQ